MAATPVSSALQLPHLLVGDQASVSTAARQLPAQPGISVQGALLLPGPWGALHPSNPHTQTGIVVLGCCKPPVTSSTQHQISIHARPWLAHTVQGLHMPNHTPHEGTCTCWAYLVCQIHGATFMHTLPLSTKVMLRTPQARSVRAEARAPTSRPGAARHRMRRRFRSTACSARCSGLMVALVLTCLCDADARPEHAFCSCSKDAVALSMAMSAHDALSNSQRLL